MENEGINYSDYFVVDPESPTGLRWRDDIKRLEQGKKGGNCWGGTPAGNFKYRKDKTPKYITVILNGKQLIVSRVIWSLLHGEIPPEQIIDHVDGNPFNNLCSNLALKTRGQNNRNARIRSDNFSGFVGVYIQLQRKTTYVVAFYSDENSKKVSKSFNVQNLGLLPAFRDAVKWRISGLLRLNNKHDLNYTFRNSQNALKALQQDSSEIGV